MPTVNEIVTGISQVIGLYGHHGALDDLGNPIKIGLKREEEYKITDRMVVDGFGVVYSDGKLKITYQSDVTVEESHEAGFETEIENRIKAVANFLTKEYKKLTGKTLSLSKQGECSMALQSTSRVRFFIEAFCWYSIGGIEGADHTFDEEVKKVDDAIKSWLSSAKEAKRPENEEISKEDNAKSKTKTPWNR